MNTCCLIVAMERNGGFFVTLPSHASLTEFPDNNAASFKVRLPQPINFHEPWEVGLSSISLPDQKSTCSSWITRETMMFSRPLKTERCFYT